MLGNNKGRVKFNFSLSSSGSQRFGIKFYFWRLVQQGAKGEGRQVTYTSTACKRLSNPQKHTHTPADMHKHAHTHRHPTPTFVGATKNLIFSHYLCILAKAAGENPNQNPNSNPNTKMKTNPNRTQFHLWKTKQSRQPPTPALSTCEGVGVCLSVSLFGCHTREFNVCVILKQCENCAYAQWCDSTAFLFPL